jgi:hypothetical protein
MFKVRRTAERTHGTREPASAWPPRHGVGTAWTLPAPGASVNIAPRRKSLAFLRVFWELRTTAWTLKMSKATGRPRSGFGVIALGEKKSQHCPESSHDTATALSALRLKAPETVKFIGSRRRGKDILDGMLSNRHEDACMVLCTLSP